jgi:cell wall-associated NlpC family hydrolase
MKNVHQGDKLPYIGSVIGTDHKSTWHHVLYMGNDGKHHEGYVYSKYTSLHSGYRTNYSSNPDKQSPDPTIMVDMTAITNPDNNKWTASSVVHDLAVQSMYIGGRGGPSDLDRKICDVWTSEYTIDDPATHQPSRYVINEHTFPYTLSYFDSAMQIVNQMGDMSFRCNRYGDIMLFRNKSCTQYDTPDWEVRDYVDLTYASIRYSSQDMRSRVLIISDNGSSLFEHKGIAFNQCKGVNRQFGLSVPFADTLEKRKEAARSAFQQLVSNWRRMTIAIVGKPMIEIGDVVRVYDMVTTATSLFKVAEFKHNFTSESFVTQLELVWISVVDENSISLLSEDVPNYSKTFRYNLKFTGNVKPMKFKMSSTVYRALIRLKDPVTDEIYANITVKGNTKTTTATVTAPQKYIKLIKDGVNVRTKADLSSAYVKKVRNSGFTMKYLAEVGNFYKGVDPEDGNEAYIWRDYCTTYETNGNPSTDLSSDGAVATFISTVLSKVGCGYVWGAQGQILTAAKLKEFESSYGYSHYHFNENGTKIDANKWIGSQVFDCSGLVVWTLQQMGLISSSSDYSAAGVFRDLCYEVSRSNIQPGDLFFRQGKGGIYHVGVIVSDTEVVEARGTSYGVIQRAIPTAEKYGRIRKLANATSYSTPQTTSSTPVAVNVTPVPTSYTITTTFNVASAPQSAKDKVKVLSGNLLFYKDDCVLYYVGVESDGGDKNELVLKWAPTVSTPKNLDLTYDVLMY